MLANSVATVRDDVKRASSKGQHNLGVVLVIELSLRLLTSETHSKLDTHCTAQSRCRVMCSVSAMEPNMDVTSEHSCQ